MISPCLEKESREKLIQPKILMIKLLIAVFLCGSVRAGYYKIDIDSECKSFDASGRCTLWKHTGDIDEKCFPGTAKILTGRGLIPLSQLKQGESVWTSCGLQPFRVWLHRIQQLETAYVRINTDLGSITLSDLHNIAVNSQNTYKFPLEIQVNDTLLSPTGEQIPVQSVEYVTGEGLYAPYTDCGDFYVGDDNMTFLVHSFAHIRHTSLYNYLFRALLSVSETFMPSLNELGSRDQIAYIHPLASHLKSMFSGFLSTPVNRRDIDANAELVASRTGSFGRNNDRNSDGESDQMIPLFGTVAMVLFQPITEGFLNATH